MDIRDFDALTRALALVTTAAAILLAISQFVDYRTIEAGTDLYEGYEGVVSAPQVGEPEATGEPHAYVFVPAAILALVILGFAIARSRWPLCRLISLIGLAAVIVAFAIDMPEGLDEGTATRDFVGAEARLLAGFWLQVGAGAVLAASSFLLGGRGAR